MARFNTVTKTGVTSPVKTVGKTTNASGKLAFIRDAKSELFLLAVSNFVGQDTFYESAKNRDDRFSLLCQKVAVEDELWFLNFVKWLRNDAFMRSAAIVAAAEGSKALLDARQTTGVTMGPRKLVSLSMARADEPGEFLAYWTSKYGKNLPQAIKKGVADAANRLYNEYSLLKYDTESKGYRFADVIQLSHAKSEGKQNDLFKYALDRRYGVDGDTTELSMLKVRSKLMSMPVEARKVLVQGSNASNVLKDAGMTWEALAGWLQGPMDSAAWEAVIPNMGYMALLRNLRNFQDAGISAKTMKIVLDKLADPAEVAKSKQFPFRFLAAYQANKGNLKISAALEDALTGSLANVPALKGKTLILVDRSGSMFDSNGGTQGLTRADTAALFGIALALRAENADLVQFGSSWPGQHNAYETVKFRKGDSIMPLLSKFKDMGGTDTALAVRENFKDHDRIVIITDEQYNGYGANPLASVPVKTPVYTWNLGGYRAAQSESGQSKRHTFGGLNDKGFQMIPLIEAGQHQNWPWQVAK